MNVYGSQLWSYNDFRAVESFYTAWRKTIRRIWRIDKRTHILLILAIKNKNKNKNKFISEQKKK